MKSIHPSTCVIGVLMGGLGLGLAVAQTSTDFHPVSVAEISPTPDATDWGNIEATYADGHKKMLTHGDKCEKPHLSPKGDIGWSVWNDFDPANPMKHTGETLRVLLKSGATKDFKPNSRFVMDWNFVDDSSAIAIASMGYHGSQFYIKYDLRTGKILGQIDQYVPYADLPKWAQPLSDDKP